MFLVSWFFIINFVVVAFAEIHFARFEEIRFVRFVVVCLSAPFLAPVSERGAARLIFVGT